MFGGPKTRGSSDVTDDKYSSLVRRFGNAAQDISVFASGGDQTRVRIDLWTRTANLK